MADRAHCIAEELLTIGAGCDVGPGVIVGYKTGRPIADHRLVLGPGAMLRSGTVIYGGSTIGARLQTGHHVVIREENRIGDDLQIWNHSTVDYGCVIGDRVKIHCACYVAQYTTIEDEVFLAPGVIVANDPFPIHPEIMRGPTIKRHARIGVNVTLMPFITIGEYSLIGGGSVVTKDIPPHSVAYGSPAKVVKSIFDLEPKYGLTKPPYPREEVF
jgi:acetyltransferase-like isoleucine patch superfamily enzyme